MALLPYSTVFDPVEELCKVTLSVWPGIWAGWYIVVSADRFDGVSMAKVELPISYERQ